MTKLSKATKESPAYTRLTFCPAHVDGKLASDRQGVAELRFSCPELAENLGDRPGLDATVQKLVQLLGPGGDLE